MINKKIKYILISGLLAAIFVLPVMALAANQALDKLSEVGADSGPYEQVTEESGVSNIAGAVIQAALALIGVIFLALMLYAGYHWMTARGEEEKVEKAKDTITRAIIGLIIVVGAYAIWIFILNQLIYQ